MCLPCGRCMRTAASERCAPPQQLAGRRPLPCRWRPLCRSLCRPAGRWAKLWARPPADQLAGMLDCLRAGGRARWAVTVAQRQDLRRRLVPCLRSAPTTLTVVRLGSSCNSKGASRQSHTPAVCRKLSSSETRMQRHAKRCWPIEPANCQLSSCCAPPPQIASSCQAPAWAPGARQSRPSRQGRSNTRRGGCKQSNCRLPPALRCRMPPAPAGHGCQQQCSLAGRPQGCTCAKQAQLTKGQVTHPPPAEGGPRGASPLRAACGRGQLNSADRPSRAPFLHARAPSTSATHP